MTIASRGYPENGVGAEVRFGEGIIGMVAEARKPIRISGLMRGDALRLRGRTSGRQEQGLCPPDAHSAARPANPESQLGVPLLVRGELVGVLCIESEEPYRFHEEDKTTIELLGSYLAIAIQNMQLQERRSRRRARRPCAAARAAAPGAAGPRRRSARAKWSTTAATSASWSTAST